MAPAPAPESAEVAPPPSGLSEVERAREAARIKREALYNILITEPVHGMKGEVYAHPGDKVRLISDCQNVLILENLKGYRFPAHTTSTDYKPPVKQLP